MTQEITAFSETEARRLVAQWREAAAEYRKVVPPDDYPESLYRAECKAVRLALTKSADELEAILPTTPCPHCDGTGQRVGENNGLDIWVEPCTQCDGKGKAK